MMLLKLYTTNSELKKEYLARVDEHNKNAMSQFPNAGFDLIVPATWNENIKTFDRYGKNTIFLDHEVKCAGFIDEKPVSYYLYPRSSMSKTPYRLANSVGIIDSGYRGNIIAALDEPGNEDSAFYTLDKNIRLVQICAPDLRPIIVQIVDSEEDLSAPTERGSGGFGSTKGT